MSLSTRIVRMLRYPVFLALLIILAALPALTEARTQPNPGRSGKATPTSTATAGSDTEGSIQVAPALKPGERGGKKTATPTATPTESGNSTPTPTTTSTPVPTETTIPTSTPTTTPTSGSSITRCLHNDRIWHALVERNADGSIKCTYGHEHGDDPKLLDYKFGPLPSHLGGEISYPHETTHENHNKHNVYKWFVVDLGNANCGAVNQPLGFRRVRLQAHADGTLGTITRRHSYFYQAETCDPAVPSYSGFIQMAGHWDYGRLVVTAPDGNIGAVSVPQNALEPVIDPNDSSTWTTDRRIEGHPDKFKGDSTWYGGNRPGQVFDPYTTPQIGAGVGLLGEAWGAIDPDTLEIHYYTPTKNFPFRNSWREPIHLLTLNTTDKQNRIDLLDGSLDGFATWQGHVTRWGRVVPAACEIGPDCVPVKLANVKVGRYQFRRDSVMPNPLPIRSYDVKDPATEQSLIEYPN